MRAVAKRGAPRREGFGTGALAAAALVALAACAPPVNAGATGGTAAKPTMTREQLLGHRQQLVRRTMNLDPQQQAAFDPIYAAYEADRVALAEDRSGFVADYGAQAAAMTPEQATALTDTFLKLRRARVDLDERYRPKLLAVLPPQKVMLFLQLNFVMDAVVNYDLAGMVPLAR